jgi:hypothetical protein
VFEESGPVVIPTSYVPSVFFVLPDISGDPSLIDTSDAAVIYSVADVDTALDVTRALGIDEQAMYPVEGHSHAELEGIANSQDTVLIGGKFANPLVSALTVPNGPLPDSLFERGGAYIHILEDAFGSHDTLVVAGYEFRDTMVASVGLIDSIETPAYCYALEVGYDGQGTVPEATPANSASCPYHTYVEGEQIQLSGAVPDSGWHIAGWTGTDNDSSSATTNQVTMPASAHTVSVRYEQDAPACYALTLDRAGSGDYPAASPPSSDGCTSGKYVGGEVINLTASPNSGWHVGNWTGTDNDSSSATTNQVTMPASGHTVTVHYEEDAPTCYALTLDRAGSGDYPVASPPSSESCSSDEYVAGQRLVGGGRGDQPDRQPRLWLARRQLDRDGQ